MRVRYKTVAIETLVARGGGEMGDGRTSDGAAQVVLTRDQHDPTGPLVRRRITRTYQRTAYALQVLTLRDEDGNEQTLRVTEEHPFYVDTAGWTPAKSLEAGDMLLGADGTLTVVANEHEAHRDGVTVYNLEVEQAHTYFVLAEDANDVAAVWVHNASETYKAMVVGDAGHHVPGVRKTQGRAFEVNRSDMDVPTVHVIGDDAARAQAHWRMHDAERLHVGPRQGAFRGSDSELFEAYRKSYQGLTDIRVNVRSRNGRVVLGEDIDLTTAVNLIEKHMRG